MGNFQYINLVNGLVEAAREVRASGIEVFIVGLDADPMPSLASAPRHFFQWSATGASAGEAAARALRAVDETTTRHDFETLTIAGTVPVEFYYVSDSANPPALWNPVSRTLAWTFPDPPSAITQTVTYDIRATTCGTFDVGTDSMAWGRDVEGNVYSLDYAPHEVHVPCPTATPKATVPVPTATATTPFTLTPAPTPVPGPLFLPVALHELPCSQQRRAALALVIDTSSSMLEPTSGGRTKLAAALSAADTFLDLLSFPADQAVVIGFDSNVQAGTLTSDRAALESQLASLTSETGTEIHLGVEAARAELGSRRRRPDTFPALVLLTDGRPRRAPNRASSQQQRPRQTASHCSRSVWAPMLTAPNCVTWPRGTIGTTKLPTQRIWRTSTAQWRSTSRVRPAATGAAGRDASPGRSGSLGLRGLPCLPVRHGAAR